MTDTTCFAVYDARYGLNDVPVSCARTDAPHLTEDIGDHCGWEQMPASERTIGGVTETWGPWQRLWTWGENGARGYRREAKCCDCNKSHPQSAHRYVPCTTCGTLYDTPVEPGMCSGCTSWSERVAEFGVLHPARRRGEKGGGFSIRPDGSDRLYGWAPGSTDGFGGRKYSGVVRLHDGTEHAFGPADSLWSSGVIPPQFRHLFPHNGVIVDPDGGGAPLG